jgi:uncharacterized membrane protein SpoIIM required for sporulation
MTQSIHNFIQSRKQKWERLEYLLQCLEKRETDRLSAHDVLDIGKLYREATADLARIQSFSENAPHADELTIYLNQLTSRAYARIYQQPLSRKFSLLNYLKHDFPFYFRKGLPWTLLAFSIFIGGFLYGFFTALNNESFIPLVVHGSIIQKVEAGEVWFDSILAIRPIASTWIMRNNISVTFLAFALGMTFGLGTTYLMAFNGLLLGTVSALCHIHGLDTPFWSFVLPHGVIELTAIFIAGGGGYLLATGLLFPGDLPRKDALVVRGRQAIQLLLGTIPMLIIAGAVEGFFSPSPLPATFKFIVAFFLLLLMIAYFIGVSSTKAPSALSPDSG